MSKHPSAAKAISFSQMPDGGLLFTYEKNCGTREIVVFDSAQQRLTLAMLEAQIVAKPEVPFA
jgi:hypothetical protein